MFKSFLEPHSQQGPSNQTNTRRPSATTVLMSSAKPRRSTLNHASTLSSLPSSSKSRSTPTASSFFTSIFATFNPSSVGGPTAGQNLKSHRSEVELRRDYLSPEREKEIGEIWEVFKRQSGDFRDDKLTSFPSISEYEYDDQEEQERDTTKATSPRRIAA